MILLQILEQCRDRKTKSFTSMLASRPTHRRRNPSAYASQFQNLFSCSARLLEAGRILHDRAQIGRFVGNSLSDSGFAALLPIPNYVVTP
jgi:hypothetical protein